MCRIQESREWLMDVPGCHGIFACFVYHVMTKMYDECVTCFRSFQSLPAPRPANTQSSFRHGKSWSLKRRNQPKERNGDKPFHKTWIPWSLRSDDRCGNMPYQTKSTENIDVVYLRRSVNSSKHGMPSCAHSSLGPTSHWRFYLSSRDVQLFTPSRSYAEFIPQNKALLGTEYLYTENYCEPTMRNYAYSYTRRSTQNTQDTRGYALPRLGFASS